MKQAVVVGSGAGGATAAKELQGRFQVTVLEAGRPFRPLAMNLAWAERMKRIGLMLDERQIQVLFPAMRVSRTADGMVLVRGIGLGGTTTLATGNGLRVDQELLACGIDLSPEFAELEREIPLSVDHQRNWRPATQRLFEICRELGFDPFPLPKMGDYGRCVNCGRCVLGCPRGAKWDSRRFLDRARAGGARVVTGCAVEQVVIRSGRAAGVKARRGWRTEFYPADLVVLAAGGLGTPPILEASGISCPERLFVDPVLCLAASWPGALQNREISMPFAAQRRGYILSPYFDYLSYFFNRGWRYPARDTLSLMIKLADSNGGRVTRRTVEKPLTAQDRETLERALGECREIFSRLGVSPDRTFLGTLNAGHPGGMLPLSRAEAATLHPSRLPENLFVADASLFPASLGNPPILSIMALAKRVSRVC